VIARNVAITVSLFGGTLSGMYLILWILTTIIFLIFNIFALTDYVSYDFLTIMVTQEKAFFFFHGMYDIFLRP
jgi:hypothetical protein